MKTSFLLRTAALAASISFALPMAAHAHRAWLLPSATVMSGNDPWVTVDAAISNDLFYFEHNALRLDGLTVIAPDGKTIAASNENSGKYRNTFDVELKQAGTYKLALINDGMSASYKVDGKNKRWRGTADKFANEVPNNAQDLNVSITHSRVETFVTAGKPNTAALQAGGKGLELVPLTHPNDLYAGESANFRFVVNGKPAADLEVSVIPGGIRYRDQLNEIRLKTDQDGKFSVKWPTPGMYYISARAGDARMEKDNDKGPVGTFAKPLHRMSYAATVEVLKP